MEPLLTDLADNHDFAGNINFEARLSATGAQPQALLDSLSGQATFAVQNGELRGLDAPALIRSARQALNGKAVGKLPSGGSTAFRALTGTLEVRNGAVFNQDLRLDGDGFRVSGKGMLFKLADRRMKYDAKLAIDPESPGGKAFELPLLCRGPVRPASCQPDLKALLKTIAGDAARKKLTATLKQALEGRREKRQKP
jgi:AsmA protein